MSLSTNNFLPEAVVFFSLVVIIVRVCKGLGRLVQKWCSAKSGMLKIGTEAAQCGSGAVCFWMVVKISFSKEIFDNNNIILLSGDIKEHFSSTQQ